MSHLSVQNTQQQEWLRFTTSPTSGPATSRSARRPVAPCDIDGIHYDQCTVATQEILDASGTSSRRSPPSRSSIPSTTTGISPRSRVRRAQDARRPRDLGWGQDHVLFVDVEFTGATGSAKKAQPRTYFECNGDLQGLASGGPTATTSRRRSGARHHRPEGAALPDAPRRSRRPLAREQRVEQLHVGRFRLSAGANPEITDLSHSPCVPDGSAATRERHRTHEPASGSAPRAP